jgi:protein TonB
VLRVVDTSGLLLSGAAGTRSRAAAVERAGAEPVHSAPASGTDASFEEPVRTLSAMDAGPGPPASAAEARIAEGAESGGGSVALEEGPPVFYAYDTAPRVRRRVEPAYPARARDAGQEGTVVVNLNIDERGRIQRAWVAEARAADVLVEAALDAAYEFEFEPGTWRGAPVRCTVAIPFQFQLKRIIEVEGR